MSSNGDGVTLATTKKKDAEAETGREAETETEADRDQQRQTKTNGSTEFFETNPTEYTKNIRVEFQRNPKNHFSVARFT